jgi:glycosyltransferase involved in cell wall biosynthesis
MKKKLLFVIPNLNIGGAEKSLVNLLNEIDYQKYAVDLLLIRAGEGMLLKQIPSQVNLLKLEKKYQVFERTTKFPESYFLLRGRLDLVVARILCRITLASVKDMGKAEQYAWKFTRLFHSKLKSEYDIAIAFLEKSSFYYISEFVSAKRKVGFIHSDYAKLNLDTAFDLRYFRKMNGIASVSSECVASLKTCFPSLKDKFRLIPNIVPKTLIHQLAKEPIELISGKPILVSVGRLFEIKGFDLAIEAAALLVKYNIDFVWYIIGDGPEKQKLEQQIIQHKLTDKVILLGMKENPYPYILKADIVLQTSRYEGKSLVLDEAKLMHKPIIATNFSTVSDQIENNKTGIIVDMNSESIANGIEDLLQNQELRNTLSKNLSQQLYDSKENLETFYKFIDSDSN